jgi:hypothetical protein
MRIKFGTNRVIDPFRSLTRTVAYVSGSARSSTTWIADIIAHASGARVVFEPLHHRGPIDNPPHFIDEDAPPEALRQGIEAALRGRFQRGTVNAFQPAGIYFRRVVKDIRPGLVPAVRFVAPQLSMVHVIRHPIEVAVSRMQLDTRDNWWDTDQAITELHTLSNGTGHLAELSRQAVAAIAEEPAELTRHVAIWCVENAIARRLSTDEKFLSLRYEDLLTDEDQQIDLLESFLNLKIDRSMLDKPTATSFRGKGAVRQLGKWRQHVDRKTAARLLRLTERFHLSELYGMNPDDDLLSH